MTTLMQGSVWPVTAAGWVALLLALLALLSAMYAYAKNLTNLNGLGGRLKLVEDEQKAAVTRDGLEVRSLDLVHEAQRGLLERIGRSDGETEQCRKSMEIMTREIGSKVDDLRRQINDEGRQTGERLQAIETELRLTRSKGAA